MILIFLIHFRLSLRYTECSSRQRIFSNLENEQDPQTSKNEGNWSKCWEYGSLCDIATT